ncbi:hypothetical protein GCM10022252_47820 [Streptosporangium oxazolinicum]|uniref:Uncharacterized protein n=1 Tax=Streptosporangium oxazolinicum TaxID=909287 RepID=A0ABP8B4Q1_9ACTN
MVIILRSSGRTGHPRRQEWRSWPADTRVTVAVNACDVPGAGVADGDTGGVVGGVTGGDAATVAAAIPVTLRRASAVAADVWRGMNAISPD